MADTNDLWDAAEDPSASRRDLTGRRFHDIGDDAKMHVYWLINIHVGCPCTNKFEYIRDIRGTHRGISPSPTIQRTQEDPAPPCSSPESDHNTDRSLGCSTVWALRRPARVFPRWTTVEFPQNRLGPSPKTRLQYSLDAFEKTLLSTLFDPLLDPLFTRQAFHGIYIRHMLLLLILRQLLGKLLIQRGRLGPKALSARGQRCCGYPKCTTTRSVIAICLP